MSAFFITGTGTSVGKTYITAGIIRAARERGRPAAAIKPVMSGFNPDDLASSDAGMLLAAMGKPATPENIAAISPWRFAAALSPDMAAARENREIDLVAVVAYCEAAIAAAGELMLIEGVGGTLVPLNRTHTVRGWISALGLPTVLVAGTYLGTINHTLTAAEALASRGVHLAAIVLSESAESPVPPEETAATLRRFLPITPIKIIARDYNDVSFRNLAEFLRC